MTIKKSDIQTALEYHNIYKVIFTNDCKIHCSILEHEEHDNLTAIIDPEYGQPKSLIVFPNFKVPNRSCIFVLYTNWNDDTIDKKDAERIANFIKQMANAHEGLSSGVIGYVN